ncbi:uncharacterized protein LOC111014436 isoform X2 [Momordica charantia]|uniref:Uncharacterized protein LOC111014436 isoform X2 n=1 Tax=Momordica charantia TaxID=3673 RepID=A0A6J1CUE4_MOMCH|nr:uncharacterized protein LOC111014436 isoform X2 [Momordica charantia]
MAEGPIALAAPSSSSSTAHCVNGKVPPRKNGLTNGCSMSMPDLKNGFNQESSSKKSTQDIVPKNKPKEIGTNQNEDNKQDGGTITEIETVQNEVNSSPTAPQGEVLVTSATQLLAAVEPSGTIIKIEIVKSILYGGLTELIASLGVVTSAASTKTTTGKVVALSLASLITGLFVMTYKIFG